MRAAVLRKRHDKNEILRTASFSCTASLRPGLGAGQVRMRDASRPGYNRKEDADWRLSRQAGANPCLFFEIAGACGY